MNKYILVNRKPVLVTNLLDWASKCENNEHRIVAKDDINGAHVSTVFLGLDHNLFGVGDPILFETMIFGGSLDEYQERCRTWEEAEEQHRVAVELVKEAGHGRRIKEEV